jgi:hypothetical protein
MKNSQMQSKPANYCNNIMLFSSVSTDYYLFLGECLVKAGYNVEYIYLLTEVGYRKTSKLKIFQIIKRVKMYIIYPIYAVLRCMTKRNKNILVVTSNTFYLVYILQKLFGRKYKIVNLIYDLFPDALATTNKIPKILERLLNNMAVNNFKNNNVNVFLGETLMKHAQKLYKFRANTATYIHIGVDNRKFLNLQKEVNNSRLINIHYGGQLGKFHCKNLFIDIINTSVIEYGTTTKYFLNISGPFYNELKQKIKSNSVSLECAINSDKWRLKVLAYDVGIVTLSSKGAEVCLPSKTYAMMASGLAIIAICPKNSDLANLIKFNDAGWVIENDEYFIALKKNHQQSINREKKIIINKYNTLLKILVNNRCLLKRTQNNAKTAVRNNYSIEPISNCWKKVLINC